MPTRRCSLRSAGGKKGALKKDDGEIECNSLPLMMPSYSLAEPRVPQQQLHESSARR